MKRQGGAPVGGSGTPGSSASPTPPQLRSRTPTSGLYSHSMNIAGGVISPIGFGFGGSSPFGASRPFGRSVTAPETAPAPAAGSAGSDLTATAASPVKPQAGLPTLEQSSLNDNNERMLEAIADKSKPTEVTVDAEVAAKVEGGVHAEVAVLAEVTVHAETAMDAEISLEAEKAMHAEMAMDADVTVDAGVAIDAEVAVGVGEVVGIRGNMGMIVQEEVEVTTTATETTALMAVDADVGFDGDVAVHAETVKEAATPLGAEVSLDVETALKSAGASGDEEDHERAAADAGARVALGAKPAAQAKVAVGHELVQQSALADEPVGGADVQSRAGSQKAVGDEVTPEGPVDTADDELAEACRCSGDPQESVPELHPRAAVQATTLPPPPPPEQHATAAEAKGEADAGATGRLREGARTRSQTETLAQACAAAPVATKRGGRGRGSKGAAGRGRSVSLNPSSERREKSPGTEPRSEQPDADAAKDGSAGRGRGRSRGRGAGRKTLAGRQTETSSAASLAPAWTSGQLSSPRSDQQGGASDSPGDDDESAPLSRHRARGRTETVDGCGKQSPAPSPERLSKRPKASEKSPLLQELEDAQRQGVTGVVYSQRRGGRGSHAGKAKGRGKSRKTMEEEGVVAEAAATVEGQGEWEWVDGAMDEEEVMQLGAEWCQEGALDDLILGASFSHEGAGGPEAKTALSVRRGCCRLCHAGWPPSLPEPLRGPDDDRLQALAPPQAGSPSTRTLTQAASGLAEKDQDGNLDMADPYVNERELARANSAKRKSALPTDGRPTAATTSGKPTATTTAELEALAAPGHQTPPPPKRSYILKLQVPKKAATKQKELVEAAAPEAEAGMHSAAEAVEEDQHPPTSAPDLRRRSSEKGGKTVLQLVERDADDDVDGDCSSLQLGEELGDALGDTATGQDRLSEHPPEGARSAGTVPADDAQPPGETLQHASPPATGEVNASAATGSNGARSETLSLAQRQSRWGAIPTGVHPNPSTGGAGRPFESGRGRGGGGVLLPRDRLVQPGPGGEAGEGQRRIAARAAWEAEMGGRVGRGRGGGRDGAPAWRSRGIWQSATGERWSDARGMWDRPPAGLASNRHPDDPRPGSRQQAPPGCVPPRAAPPQGDAPSWRRVYVDPEIEEQWRDAHRSKFSAVLGPPTAPEGTQPRLSDGHDASGDPGWEREALWCPPPRGTAAPRAPGAPLLGWDRDQIREPPVRGMLEPRRMVGGGWERGAPRPVLWGQTPGGASREDVVGRRWVMPPPSRAAAGARPPPPGWVPITREEIDRERAARWEHHRMVAEEVPPPGRIFARPPGASRSMRPAYDEFYGPPPQAPPSPARQSLLRTIAPEGYRTAERMGMESMEQERSVGGVVPQERMRPAPSGSSSHSKHKRSSSNRHRSRSRKPVRRRYARSRSRCYSESSRSRSASQSRSFSTGSRSSSSRSRSRSRAGGGGGGRPRRRVGVRSRYRSPSSHSSGSSEYSSRGSPSASHDTRMHAHASGRTGARRAAQVPEYLEERDRSWGQPPSYLRAPPSSMTRAAPPPGFLAHPGYSSTRWTSNKPSRWEPLGEDRMQRRGPPGSHHPS